jgi:hypothetical protein
MNMFGALVLAGIANHPHHCEEPDPVTPLFVQRSALGAFLICIAGLSAACSDDSDPSGPNPPNGNEITYDSITVDASAGWAAIRLGEPASVVSVADLEASPDWDIALNATSVKINGGDAGPGDISAYCICQNGSATDTDVGGFTAAGEQADFVGVTASDIPPAADAFQGDTVALAIDGWWNYDITTHVVSAAPEKSWLVRTAGGTSYAQFHVTDIANGSMAAAGDVTIEFQVQPGEGQPMGATQTATITVPDDGSTVRFDFETGAVTTGDDWDIGFRDYTIITNGGAHGEGGAGAVPLDDPFGMLTSADGIPSTAFLADGFGGVFTGHKWYRYNIHGDDHQIWPTFDVYLVKRGTAVYKVQFISYYSSTAEARHVTLRYERLAE